MEINRLPVTLQQLQASDTSHITDAFRESAMPPERVRQLRGRVLIEYVDLAHDPRPLASIGPVRRFVQKVDSEIPHFPIFLLPDPLVGEVLAYVLCLVPETKVPKDFQRTFIATIRRKMEEVASFARRVGIDEDDAVVGLYLAMPATALAAVPTVRARALDVVRPMLVNILERDEADSAQAQRYLAWAEEVTRLPWSEYKTSRDYLRAVVQWSPE